MGERDREQLLRATFVLSVRRSAPLPMAQIEPENEALPQRVENLLYGLVVSGGVGYKKAYRVAGAHLGDRVEARIDLEQQTFFPSMYGQAGQPPLPLTPETFHSARRFAERLERVRQEHVLKAKDDRAYWRFISGLSAFLDGCRTRVDRYDVRLHQIASPVSLDLAFRQAQVSFSRALQRSSKRKGAEPFRARSLISRGGQTIF